MKKLQEEIDFMMEKNNVIESFYFEMVVIYFKTEFS